MQAARERKEAMERAEKIARWEEWVSERVWVGLGAPVHSPSPTKPFRPVTRPIPLIMSQKYPQTSFVCLFS